MTARTAVLLLTHVWTPAVRARFLRLQREIGDRAEVFLLAQDTPATRNVLARDFAADCGALVMFDAALLPHELGYPYLPGKSVVPGSTHFPLLAFFRRSPEYDFYMVIEHDVEFSGNWRDLVEAVTVAAPDFASSHLRSYEDGPEWPWWPLVRAAECDRDWLQDRRNLRRSFNPVYCIAHKALELVDDAQRLGWRGHYEILLATIIARRGGRLLSLATLGFYDGAEQDPLPGLAVEELSTVRWRPPVTPDEFRARSTGRTVFHPVKTPWSYDGSRIVGFPDADSLDCAP